MEKEYTGFDIAKQINTRDTRADTTLYPSLDEVNARSFADNGRYSTLKITERRIYNSTFSRAQIRNFVNNPKQHKKELQIVSEELYAKSGQYFRGITHFSNILRLDHYLTTSEILQTPSLDEYVSAGRLLEKFNIRKQIPKILKELLLYGEVYLYKTPTNNDTYNEMVVIPKEYCEVDEIRDGIKRYIIRPTIMPKELRDALPRGVLNGWDGENHIHKVDNNGVAFLSGDIEREGYPMLIFMFDPVLGLEEAKDLSDVRDEMDTFQMLHQEIPLDEERREVTMNVHQVKRFHDAMVDRVPPEMRVVTTPLEVTPIEIKRPGELDVDMVSKAQRDIWQSSGVSETLFGSRFTGAEAARQSLTSDTLVVAPLIDQIEEYLNWELRDYKFKIKIMDTTHFNHNTISNESKNAMDSGGSRLVYLASTGRDPLEAVGLMSFEQNVLNIDDIMRPKQTAYTMSSKDVGKVGRPSEQDKLDKGETITEPKSSNPDKEVTNNE